LVSAFSSAHTDRKKEGGDEEELEDGSTRR